MKDYKELKGKIMYELIDPKCLESLAKVLTYGVEKYGVENKDSYKYGEFDTYYSAFMRHIEAHRQGMTLDKESGLKHVEHALFNAYAMLYVSSREDTNSEPKLKVSKSNLCGVCGDTYNNQDLFWVDDYLICTDCLIDYRIRHQRP